MRPSAEPSAVEASELHHQSRAESQVPEDIADCLRPYVTAESRWWPWKYNSRIHFRQQGTSGPCILLVHGFGVGAFHFEDLVQQLSTKYQVWAIDLLGQGMSWPAAEPPQGGA